MAIAESKLEQRVIRAAEAALSDRHYVSAIDVLIGLGWLAPTWVDAWRQGRLEYLERAVDVGPGKPSSALRVLDGWAVERGLVSSETAYVARSRDRQPLRFSESGDPAIEKAYRTHWISPELSEPKRARLAERLNRPADLVVIMPVKDWSCSSCGGTGGFLIMDRPGPLCMACADLDHLVFLPSGDAALTRRAKQASRLSAVVVRFSRARRRYERQGVLVEEPALEQAEAQCLADEDARTRRRERDAVRRAEEDVDLQDRMAAKLASLFPGCPSERAQEIARHAAARGSGRVGRSAAGRALDEGALELAVVASVRHRDTSYDSLLMAGMDRGEAREQVRGDVTRIVNSWRAG